MLNYRFGRENVDNEIVSKMSEIDPTWEGGAFISYSKLNIDTIPWRFRIGVGALSDLGSRYDGWSAFGWTSLWVPLHRKVFLGFGASVSSASNDFMQLYYGVNEVDSASSGLPRYQPSSGLKNYTLWPALIFQINEKWAVGSGFLYQKLIDDAAESPLVVEQGQTGQYIFGIGIGYLWK